VDVRSGGITLGITLGKWRLPTEGRCKINGKSKETGAWPKLNSRQQVKLWVGIGEQGNRQGENGSIEID